MPVSFFRRLHNQFRAFILPALQMFEGKEFDDMSWMGALTGGAIGGMFGGPAGAVLGAVIGHLVTKETAAGAAVSDSDRKQAVFVVSMFSCLAKFAKADGVVSPEEDEYIRRFIDTHFAPTERDAVRRIFESARSNSVSYRYYVDRMAEAAADRSLLQQFLGVLCELAMADGNLDAAEKEMLRYAETRFGFTGYTEAFFGRSGAAASGGSLTAYYEVLGCTASATDQELKSAWRKKCADFHPDKIQAKGLPPEFIEFAKNEMQRINRAYDELRKARGFK